MQKTKKLHGLSDSLHSDSLSLIHKYRQTNDEKYRNDLIMKHIDIVRFAALSIRNMAVKFADYDDLINEGVISLINAIETFDENKGAKFETYASLKVRGGLIDFIRKQDWVPRNVRKFSKELDIAFSKLYNELGRVPEDEELAVELDMNYDKFQRTLAQSANAVTLSFEELIFEDSIDRLSSRNDSEGVDFAILEKELKNVIKIAIGELKPKEKQVITLYYYKRLKFSDIAKVLSVTESRISQIHSKAILTLKTKLEEYL